jgi:hypothetical protein
MLNLQTGIAIFGLFLILFGILYVIQHKRRIVIPEGFTTDYDPVDLSTIGDPITKIIKKIGGMSAHFANPEVWKDAYNHSQMSLTDLARAQIAKDKKN